MSIFSRRSGRAEYWAYTAALIVAGFAITEYLPKSNTALVFPWIMIWAWRLHDFGKSGFISAIPVGVMIAIAVGAFAFGGPDFLKAVSISLGTAEGDASELAFIQAIVFMLALLGTQLGYMIWLGIKRGDPGDNRFGPPTKLFGKS